MTVKQQQEDPYEKEEQDIVYDAIIEEHDAPNSLITVSAVATTYNNIGSGYADKGDDDDWDKALEHLSVCLEWLLKSTR